MGSKRLVLPVRLNYDDEARRWYVMSAPVCGVSSVVAECYSRSDADAVIAALNSNAERDRLAAQLREREAELAEEREARNRIARENADRIGRAVDADKAAVVEFARAVLADRNWYCHDHGLDDAPLVREMAEQIEEGNSRGLIDVVMNALREAQAATRRECGMALYGALLGAEALGAAGLLADRWLESTPAAPAPDPAAQGSSVTQRADEAVGLTQGKVRTMEADKIAKVCHEVNRAYCESLGDTSQPKWDDAPDWQRSSAINGVEMHLANPDAGPEASHEAWLAEKVANGWTYGPVKNPDAKQHPCIVPFADLPREQQAKDFIFRAVVHALAD